MRFLIPALLAGALAAPAHAQEPFTLRFDYGGAERLIAALERDSLSEAAVDSLLREPGVRAMVDNVHRFIPEMGDAEFRAELIGFARTKQGGAHNRFFQLADVWEARAQTRRLIEAIRSDEARILRRTVEQLRPYQPATGPLPITLYLVAGGVSDGFVFDHDPRPAFYANLTRSDGDFEGFLANVGHEAYHVMQKAAQRRVRRLAAVADSSEVLPLPDRLLAVTLAEGTANYVVDPTRSTAAGASVEASRERYRRNLSGARIQENFALFDAMLAELRAGSTDWNAAYQRGFSGNNDARFYFVGYEMARAVERHCGRACVGRLFERQPIEFFRQYVALYRAHPEITGRFSPETEAYLLGR